MGVQPTRPQQVYSGQPLPPAHQYPPRPPQYYPGQPPVPGPPSAPHRPPRKGWTLRQKLLTAAGAAALVVVAAAAIGLSQHRGGPAALNGCSLTAAIYTSAEGPYTSLQTDMSGASFDQVQQDAGDLQASAASWYGASSPMPRLFSTYAKNVQGRFQAALTGGDQSSYFSAASAANATIQQDLNACGI